MKLRILGNSLRFRLTQNEVAALASEGRVEEETHMGGGQRLRYALATREGTGRPAARLEPSAEGPEILVTLPRSAVASWSAGDEVGIHAEQGVGERALEIRVEKDFRCLTPRGEGEDAPDAYPHPKEGEVEC